MGTPGAIIFLIRGRKYSIHCHKDAYPSYRGQEIVDFIVALDDDEIESMAEKVAQIKWYTQISYWEEGWIDCETRGLAEPDTKVSDYWENHTTLPSIFSGTALHWSNALDQGEIEDWSYHLDFDSGRFAVYRNEKRLEEQSFGDLRRINATEPWSVKYEDNPNDEW